MYSRLIFSIIIAAILIVTSNYYFSFFKLKRIVIPLLIDCFLLALLTFSVLTLATSFKYNVWALLLIVFCSFLIYVGYLTRVREYLYVKYLEKIRDNSLENLFSSMLSIQIKIFIVKEANKIIVLTNKKQVILPSNIYSTMEEKEIYNVIAFYLRRRNKLLDICFTFFYFSPLLIFFYAAEYATGSLKTILILFASGLIPIIKRLYDNRDKYYSIKYLKSTIEKDDLINSIRRYHRLLSGNFSYSAGDK